MYKETTKEKDSIDSKDPTDLYEANLIPELNDKIMNVEFNSMSMSSVLKTAGEKMIDDISDPMLEREIKKVSNKRGYKLNNDLVKHIEDSDLVFTEEDRQTVIRVAPWATGSVHKPTQTLRRRLAMILPFMVGGKTPSTDILRRYDWPKVKRQCELLHKKLAANNTENLWRSLDAIQA